MKQLNLLKPLLAGLLSLMLLPVSSQFRYMHGFEPETAENANWIFDSVPFSYEHGFEAATSAENANWMLVSNNTPLYRYTHGFETSEATENANWNLIPDGAQSNRWIIGSAIGRSSSRSLYISSDNGTTTNYVTQPAVAIAYREFTFRPGVSYAISYDWRMVGNVNDSLYVCWVTDTSTVMAAGPNNTLPEWVHTTVKHQAIALQPNWYNDKFLVKGTGLPSKLVFVWKNANPTASNPAPSIDNLVIQEVANQWTLGSAIARTGSQSLYLSCDSGHTVTYVSDTTVAIAYREFTLPAGIPYAISYDWRVMGNANDSLYVCWVDDTTTTMQPGPNNSLPAWVHANVRHQTIGTEALWQSNSFRVVGTGAPGKLVFVWKNNNSEVNNPAPAIDNVAIKELVNRWTIGRAVRRTGDQSLYISRDQGASVNYVAEPSTAIAYREFTLPDDELYSVAFNWRGMGNINDSLYVCWVNDSTASMQSGPNEAPPTWLQANLKLQLNGSPILWRDTAFTVMGTGAPGKLVFLWNNSNPSANNPAPSIDNIVISKVFVPGNYICDFEDPTETATWTILNNPGAATNKWVVGSAEYTSPNHSLYISPDNGFSATYVNNSCNVFFIKEMTIPIGVDYTVAFDWKAFGEANVDFLSAHWVTDSTTIVNPNTNNLVASWANTTQKGRYQTKLSWQNASFTLRGTGRPGRLVFMWRNNGSNNGPLSACIDNIQISDERICPRPSNLEVKIVDRSAILSWNGAADVYEIMYRNDFTNGEYVVYSGVSSSPDTIPDLERGRYTFMVRSICGNDTSIWTTVHNILQVADMGCINYIDLDNPGLVTANYGVAPGVDIPVNVFLNTGLIDYGQESGLSRHTVNTEQTLDPRTNNRLKTIPDNELATIRLGNWNYNSEGEALTYKFMVDSTHAIFLMNYAIVFENPDHSNPPEFLMEILNAQGQRIDPSCGIVNFTTNDAAAWYRNNYYWNSVIDAPRPTSPSVAEIMWKDWTKVGYNLQPHIGETVQVRLVTKDCARTGHCGYAYFTISCAENKLEGLSCSSEGVDTITAPEGFVYKWFRADDPTMTSVSTTRWFTPEPTDTNTYICRMSLYDNLNCFFDLTASLRPRWPKALATWQWTPDSCQNIVTMVNNSVITTAGGAASGERPDLYRWKFSNDSTSREVNPVITFPNEGGRFTATLIAGLSRSDCTDSTVVEFTLPNIGENTFERVLGSVCGEGDSIVVNHKAYYIPGVYLDTTKTIAGCDSTIEITVVNGSSIIEQNWNNVIAVLNDQYNGGFVFTSYQWYKNDLPIAGETKSYIYIPEGLDLTADYKVLVTTTNDSTFFTCPIRPEPYVDMQVVPTVVFPRNVIQVNAPDGGIVNVWSVTGVLVDTHRITATNGQITSPSVPGMYILEIILDSGLKQSVRIVVRKE